MLKGSGFDIGFFNFPLVFLGSSSPSFFFFFCIRPWSKNRGSKKEEEEEVSSHRKRWSFSCVCLKSKCQ